MPSSYLSCHDFNALVCLNYVRDTHGTSDRALADSEDGVGESTDRTAYKVDEGRGTDKWTKEIGQKGLKGKRRPRQALTISKNYFNNFDRFPWALTVAGCIGNAGKELLNTQGEGKEVSTRTIRRLHLASPGP